MPRPTNLPKHPLVNQIKPRRTTRQTTIANEADSASCKIKSNDSAIRINTGETALQVEGDTQGEISGANDASSSEDSLTLQAPSREESALDQTHLSSEITAKEQSRKDKSDSPKTAIDLKCTPKESGNKNPSPASN